MAFLPTHSQQFLIAIQSIHNTQIPNLYYKIWRKQRNFYITTKHKQIQQQTNKLFSNRFHPTKSTTTTTTTTTKIYSIINMINIPKILPNFHSITRISSLPSQYRAEHKHTSKHANL